MKTQLVPVEMTQEMKDKAQSKIELALTVGMPEYDLTDGVEMAWRAALEAAPTPPAPDMREWIQKLIAAVHFADKSIIEERAESSSKDWVLDHFIPALTEHGLGICLLQSAPTPPAQEDDVNSCTSRPVVAHETGNVNDKQDSEVGILYVSLFRGHLENTHFDYYGDLPEGSYSLYTRPDNNNSKLRKAAVELLDALSVEYNKIEEVINLRSALEGK